MGWEHKETIRCPACEGICNATVTQEDDEPWPCYVHICEHCSEIIGESEWERIDESLP